MKDSDWKILHELYKMPNITKVANMMYMTQPSLTKRLKSMENEFQIKIVSRNTKGVEFTPEGEYLAKQAEKYISFINETRRTLNSYREEEIKTIKVGSSYTFSKYQLTDLLFKYSKHCPDSKFEISNEQSNIIFKKVVDKSIDAGFIRGDYEGNANKVLIGRENAYILSKEPIELDSLHNMNRIYYHTNDKSKMILDKWWEDKFGVEPPKGMMAGHVDFAWQLVDKALGYCCCYLSDTFENEFNLTLTPILNSDGSSVYRNTWFVYSDSSNISNSLKKFVKYIEKNIAIKI